jgi:hypothetical protein
MDPIPHFPSFDFEADKANAGPRWNKWVNRLENMFVALDLESKDDDARMRALLLHYAGENVHDIYEAECGSSTKDYAGSVKVLTDYFNPKKNVQMEIYTFRNCSQKESQTLDEFVTELRTLAKDCEFTSVDKEILSQVIQHCRSNRLRRRALREPDKNLAEIMELGRTMELVDTQAETMEKASVQAVNKGRNTRETGRTQSRYQGQGHAREQQRTRYQGQGQSQEQERRAQKCMRCCGAYPHTQGPCPAQGKICGYCKKPNHFTSACLKLKRKEAVKGVAQEASSSDDEYEYSIECDQIVGVIGNKTPKVTIVINKTECRVLVDTGASVNILDEDTYEAIGRPTLTKNKLPSLHPYGGGAPLKVLGMCEVAVESKERIQCAKFFVVPGRQGTLVGYSTSTDLGLIHIIQGVAVPGIKYPKLFKGIGKLKNTKVKLHIDKTVRPVAQRHRRTPFHIRPQVEREIDKLLQEDIIEKVEGEPTPWVSPIVTPPKKDPNSIRLCVDMREANRAIQRERHQMPTVEELIHDLNGASVFSKLDMRSGYHQLELEEESRYITTFSTHVGLFRYKRLNFGVSSASEIFQETIRQVLQDIPHVKNIVDDIIIYGKTQVQHDRALEATFERLQEHGLTLNDSKCEYNKPEVEFYGMVFSGKGISPDPKKIQAISELEPPQNVSEVRSLLGTLNYVAKFIPDFATVCEPIRRLMRKDAEWEWSEDQQKSFQSLKNKLTDSKVMSYYSPEKKTEIVVDASPVGLGAILTQEDNVVCYASRALTDTESRYSQMEREALAIVWACEHFDMYVRGAQHFTVITDHKPLEKIWQKTKPPLRIERWGLRLQPYKLSIKYRPGSENPADYMSRHPVGIKQVTSREQDIAEQYVNWVAESSIPTAMKWEEVKTATVSDKTLPTVMELVRTGRWFETKTLDDQAIDRDELQSFKNVKDELTCHPEGILLRGDQVVLPLSLRERAVALAHEGHQGMHRTKAFMRSKVWFPGLNGRVENAVKGCMACQVVYADPKQLEPLQMSEMPERAWQCLSADFCGPLPTGEYLMVVTDEHSRYPVVEIVRSVSASVTIPVLDKILSDFGTPEVIKTDNGSPFNSHAFAKFAEDSGFKHRRVTPLWPRANSQAEAFNKPMMKSVRAACIEQKNWKKELYRFLRQYRATPHPSTGITPYLLLFKRQPKTKLPQDPGPQPETEFEKQARQKDNESKSRMKSYADKRNNAQPSGIEVGDTVIVRQDKRQDKVSPPYVPRPNVVVEKKGNMITATSGAKNVTRNSSFFKKVKPDLFDRPEQETEVEEEDPADNLEGGRGDHAIAEPPDMSSPDGEHTSRPGRNRHEPGWMKDYVRF